MVQNYWDGRIVDMLSSTNTARKSSRNALQTDTLIERPSSLTCVSSSSPVQLNSIEELRMWLLAAFPASHSQLPESKPEQTMPEICGQQQPTLFASSDLPAFSWKTYRDYFSSTTPKVFSLTLPKWGMWESTGLYPLPMWEPDTDGNDCGSLEDWPTPTQDSATERSVPYAQGGMPLTLAVKNRNWPSPTCSDVYTGNLKSTQQKPGSMHSVTLPQAVAMWPTPTSHLAKETGAPSEYDRNEPTISSRVFNGDERNGMALNPDWDEWLMGWPVGWSDIKPLSTLNWRDWQTDPADISEVPRVTDVKENRANRLKAIGNGQVPQCVVKAWELLA